jgi:serine protease Do
MRKLLKWGGIVLGTALLWSGVAGPPAVRAATDTDDDSVPFLGVELQPLTDALREGLSYDGDGVLVSRVQEDSPADQARIKKGDIIISLNSRSMKSPDELTNTIRDMKVGQKVSVAVWRKGERQSLDAQLAERPDDMSRPDSGSDDLGDLPRKTQREMGPMMRWHDDGNHMYMFRSMGRGRLGVRVESLNSDLGSYFDKSDGKGAVIVEVLKDTPADRAGLKAGDVITQIGDHDIDASDDVVQALDDAPKGPVSITVMRRGQTRKFSAELEASPRAYRVGPGRDLTVVRPQNSTKDEEVQRLRDQVKELEDRLDKLESGKN